MPEPELDPNDVGVRSRRDVSTARLGSSAAERSASGVSFGQWPHWTKRVRAERLSADSTGLEIWGYTGQPSYAPGDRLELHVSTTAEQFGVTVYRDGAAREVVLRETGLRGGAYPMPEDAYSAGCDWPVAFALAIPVTWTTGGYIVELRAQDERGEVVQDAFFVLRPLDADADRGARIVMIVATYTWQEYNDWGGASGYSLERATGTFDVAAQRAPGSFSPRLSYQRPWARGLIRAPREAPRVPVRSPPAAGWVPRYESAEWAIANGFSLWSTFAGWDRFDGPFIRWAEANDYAIDLVSQWDLDMRPGILDPYSCVVTVGHDEYWTAEGRRQLDAFIEHGGRYARLAGNILWQIRIEDQGRTQVCYKYLPTADPLATASDVSHRTGAFEYHGIANPPVTTFGGNGSRGIYARYGGASPRGIGGFVVYRNHHWVFEGTDLYYGDVVGSAIPLVGYECDGVAYTFECGLPRPTGADGTPANLAILALTPASLDEEDHGHAGSVFLVGEGDLAFVAEQILGKDTPDNRERARRGAATMTYMQKGKGEVFGGGSTEWPFALQQKDAMAERIVGNVLDRFARP